ncbi:hypothetical protein HMPREF1286_00122 [Corynebacterium sp. KPL1860]|nr:hypothetical protein HMPREF1286_00122 [Corynebacterium sp. KPL1860]ERS77988.1 hypothetical protein HMPREF1283_00955 [Corynebacterium sp. KPL1857]
MQATWPSAGPTFCHFTGFSTALKELFLALYYMLLFCGIKKPRSVGSGVRRSAAAIARTQAGPGAQALGVALQEECLGCGNIFDLGGIHRLIGGVNGALGLLHTVEGDLRVRMRLLQLGG